MMENYYRVTFEGIGYFSAVHELIDYLGDAAYDEYDENACYDISEALANLERGLYCPDIKLMEAIFAYTESGYERFRSLLEKLSDILVQYGFEKLVTKMVDPAEIIYKDKDQIAFVPKEEN